MHDGTEGPCGGRTTSGGSRPAGARPDVVERPLLSRGLVVLVGLVLVGAAVYAMRGVLTPIFTALGIAYLLDPLVDRFEVRGIPRGVAIAFVLAGLLVAVALFLLLVLPGVIHEVSVFLSGLPDELAELLSRLEPVLAEHGVAVPHSVNEALERLELDPATIASHAAAPAQAVLRGVLGGTASVVGTLASALVVPVLAFYLLYDFDRMTAAARDLVPMRLRPRVVEIAREIDEMLGQFVRGQLLVMIAMAFLYAVAYSLVGIRLAIPIALVAGLLAFIPYVGSGSALAMGLAMCLVDWDGWTRPVLVLIAYGICQALEGFVIIPRVVGDKVGLPAVWVLVALMIGGEIFGFLGVLLAVPVAAVAKIFVVRGLAWYRASPYYLGPEAKPTAVEARGPAAEHELGTDERASDSAARDLAASEASPTSDRTERSVDAEAEGPERSDPLPTSSDVSGRAEPDGSA